HHKIQMTGVVCEVDALFFVGLAARPLHLHPGNSAGHRRQKTRERMNALVHQVVRPRISRNAPRARFAIVTSRSTSTIHWTGMTTRKIGNCNPRSNPRIPKTNARSLFPIGPSYRREAPIWTATTPVI